MPYKLIIDGAALAYELKSEHGVLGRFMMGRATVVQLAAKRQVNKKSHDLERSIVKRFYTGPEGISISIAALQPYAMWIHEGTGIYGPLKHRIFPVSAKVLAFRWDAGPYGPEGMGGTGLHFYKSVAGIKPNRFLTDNMRLFWAI